MLVVRVQVGVRKRIAVRGMLVGVNKPRRQDRFAAAIEHGRVRIGLVNDVEFADCANAAVEPDVHRIVGSVPLGQEHVTANDEARNDRAASVSRRREAA